MELQKRLEFQQTFDESSSSSKQTSVIPNSCQRAEKEKARIRARIRAKEWYYNNIERAKVLRLLEDFFHIINQMKFMNKREKIILKNMAGNVLFFGMGEMEEHLNLMKKK